MDYTAADMSSNTPPPVLQSESPKTLRPPSFESFMMNAPEPPSMNPEDQLLNNEIQEITPEEYKQNLIEAQIGATQLAMAFSQMSLPRSLKSLAKKLLETCEEKKKEYQSTGAIPVEELIQIKLVSPEGASQLEGTLKRKGKSNSESSKTQAKKKRKNPNRVNILKIIKTPDALPISLSQSQIPSTVYSPISLNNNRSNTVPLESQLIPLDSPVPNNSNCSNQESVFSDSSLNLSENIRNTINNAKSVLSIMENTTQDINAINSNSEAFAIPQYSTYDPVSNTISPREIISPSVISKNSSPNFNGGTSPNVDLVSAQALTAEIIRVPEDSQTGSAPNEETNNIFFQTGRASQAKYLEAWKSITKFVTRHATNLPPTTNTLENFAFNPGTCLYQTWLKNIVDLGKEVLKPSSTEPWFKPEIIDFDLLESFNNHENTLQPKDYISITAKSSHPETNLVRFLYSLRFTSQTSIQSWARIVAASIETVANELHQPAAPKAHQPISNLNAHLETIKWLESFKKGKSTRAIEGFGALENSTSRELKNELQDFYNVIIDVMISYSIFQAQAHVEYEEKNKKKNPNSIRKYSSTKNNSLGAAHQKLNAYRSRHNFQSFIFFLVAGVRGLFCSSRDYRWVSVSDSMDFICANKKIYEHSNTPFPPKIPQFKPPSQHALAVAIATDFLIHWQVNSPSSQFVIPQKNSAITL
ncbi:hypothetical protein BY996DRAFT_6426085 [Phakopsora pachyrhizi]|nr:hypothetical protein BY996DRAFT_6426085 [Phakopsora pachyrhizi]